MIRSIASTICMSGIWLLMIAATLIFAAFIIEVVTIETQANASYFNEWFVSKWSMYVAASAGIAFATSMTALVITILLLPALD